MAPTSDSQPDNNPAGTTLYLESDELDPTEAFCTEVFDEAEEGDYRVVQLTATQSFESLSDALNLQLEHIRDPSEAAVIITTPQADKESTTAEVGDGTLLHGFRVSPEDLTGISIAFSRLVESWESTEGAVKICLRDIESLLPYHDSDLIYRFLNTVLATLQGTGAEVHAHFTPGATDEQTLQMLQSLFDEVVDEDESRLETAQETVAESAEDRPTTAPVETGTKRGADAGAPDDVAATTMSTEEVHEFLQSEGYGILAFDGDSPYAIPMSYGYDPGERVLYVHMATYAGSEKGVASKRQATSRWSSRATNDRISGGASSSMDHSLGSRRTTSRSEMSSVRSPAVNSRRSTCSTAVSRRSTSSGTSSNPRRSRDGRVQADADTDCDKPAAPNHSTAVLRPEVGRRVDHADGPPVRLSSHRANLRTCPASNSTRRRSNVSTASESKTNPTTR